eukprot:11764867-Alexandrium_andersonii.AAC.1
MPSRPATCCLSSSRASCPCPSQRSAWLEIAAVYAPEVCEDALRVALRNWPEAAQLGRVENVRDE